MQFAMRRRTHHPILLLALLVAVALGPLAGPSSAAVRAGIGLSFGRGHFGGFGGPYRHRGGPAFSFGIGIYDYPAYPYYPAYAYPYPVYAYPVPVYPVYADPAPDYRVYGDTALTPLPTCPRPPGRRRPQRKPLGRGNRRPGGRANWTCRPQEGTRSV